MAGRFTSILTSTIFSSLITIFMETFFAPLYSFFQKQNFIVLCIVTVLLLILMMIDFIYHACRMYKIQGMDEIWRIDIGKKLYKKYN